MGDKKRKIRGGKRKFCGVLPKEKNQDGVQTTNNNNVTGSQCNASSSSTKIGQNTGSIGASTSVNYMDGVFLLLDISILFGFIENHVQCEQCCGPVSCRLDMPWKQGFAHRVVLFCETCQLETVAFETSKKQKTSPCQSTYDINQRMVAYSRAIGKGHRALVTLCQYANSLPPMAKSAYQKLLTRHSSAYKKIAEESMSNAANEVVQSVGEDCTVSVDGTWQKRGHVSHHGIVTAISIDTGKCVDCETLSNICHACRRRKPSDLPEYL